MSREIKQTDIRIMRIVILVCGLAGIIALVGCSGPSLRDAASEPFNNSSAALDASADAFVENMGVLSPERREAARSLMDEMRQDETESSTWASSMIRICEDIRKNGWQGVVDNLSGPSSIDNENLDAEIVEVYLMSATAVGSFCPNLRNYAGE